MDNLKKIVIGIILGDHSGIGPEITAKMLAKNKNNFIPVLIGSRKIYESLIRKLNFNTKLLNVKEFSEERDRLENRSVYFLDIKSGSDIKLGSISADSGHLVYNSILKGIELQKTGYLDGLIMGPITKQALHMAGLKFSSEFELFASVYGVPKVKSVIKCEDIFRATVVGHCSFIKIVDNLSVEEIVITSNELLNVMHKFVLPEECKIAVAALNPHAGEDGLFGDEEAKIITPAINRLKHNGENVIGPCPADTVFLKARCGEVRGIVYLYHDQGNIAMKSSFFGDGVLIYTNIPGLIVSMSHGSALDIAGKGIADEKNMAACVDTLITMIGNRRKSDD
jgi:4-hydroxythreonine-4-phosphate dehydrogenase